VEDSDRLNTQVWLIAILNSQAIGYYTEKKVAIVNYNNIVYLYCIIQNYSKNPNIISVVD